MDLSLGLYKRKNKRVTHLTKTKKERERKERKCLVRRKCMYLEIYFLNL